MTSISRLCVLAGIPLMEGFKNLQGIIAYAEKIGVRLRATETRAKIKLDYIVRDDGSDKGSGRTIMRELCQYADARHKPIYLYVMDYSPKLVDYYESFGFETDLKKNDEAFMVRKPTSMLEMIEDHDLNRLLDAALIGGSGVDLATMPSEEVISRLLPRS